MSQFKRPLRDEDRPIVGREYDPQPTPAVIPASSIGEEPTYCLPPINVNWFPVFLGLMAALDQYDSWKGDDPQITDAREQVRRWLASIELCDEELIEMAYYLRQNEENPCLLEQSQDGETWSPAFDFSLCMGSLSATNELLLQQNNQYWINIWDNDNNNEGVAPVLTDVGTDPDNRHTAICVAMEWWVRSVMAAARARKEGEERRDALAKIALGTLGVVAASLTGGLSVWVAAGIATAILYTAADWLDNISAAELTDEEAMRSVWCCYADYLDEWGVSQGIFLEMCSSCGGEFGVGSLEQRMCAILCASMYEPEAWIAWLRTAEYAVDLAFSDIIDCNCGTIICASGVTSYIDWDSTGATPEEWSSPVGVPPGQMHAEVYKRLSRNANQQWDRVGDESWYSACIIREFEDPTLVSQLGMKAWWDTSNQKTLRFSYRDSVGIWHGLYSENHPVPANLTYTASPTFAEVCATAVRFEVWGRGCRIEITTINTAV